MAAPGSYRPSAGDIPDAPGVYRFRDGDGEVVYVGKARSLRSRLNSYFADPRSLHPRTYAMVNAACALDWVTVSNEVEALQLEYSWIKQYDPRFNVRYRDDKSYPYLAVTMNERFPRVQVMRGTKKPGVRYFGPYAHAWAIRETVDQLLRVFPMRSCSKGVFVRHERMERPCLLGDIGRCAAPCVERVTEEEHRAIAEELCRFLSGRPDSFIRSIEAKMQAASAEQDYESAARLRDDLGALRRALARSAVVLPDGVDADVVGVVSDELQASVQVFHIRGGRVTGQRGFIVERTVDSDDSHLLEQLVMQLYGDEDGTDAMMSIPREVLTSHPVADLEILTPWLSAKRGSKVSIAVPMRGSKRELMDTVVRNAEQSLNLHKVRRASDLSSRSQALEQLQEYLDLPLAPLRIECIDISGHHGTDLTASIVVFEDGLAKKSEYRKYAITDYKDDLAAMYEAVTRRFGRFSPESAQDDEVRTRYRPGLLVVDGGAPQVQAAVAALTALGIDFIAVCGLAKRLEEVWLPSESDPIILPRRSEGLFLLQRVRDEAHRFAVAYHRQRRGARAIASVLDEVPGLGPAKRKAVLKHFGSVRKLKAASLTEIQGVPGVGPVLAQSIATTLSESGPAKDSAPPGARVGGNKPGLTAMNGGINVTTGEILGEASGHVAEQD
ncbi:MAG: excinuclease ABC subunit UvrC [Actinobacteria bacterium]|nr:excinuclease ABC subunit UvrC [Actinomycetota bacterium]